MVDVARTEDKPAQIVLGLRSRQGEDQVIHHIVQEAALAEHQHIDAGAAGDLLGGDVVIAVDIGDALIGHGQVALGKGVAEPLGVIVAGDEAGLVELLQGQVAHGGALAVEGHVGIVLLHRPDAALDVGAQLQLAVAGVAEDGDHIGTHVAVGVGDRHQELLQAVLGGVQAEGAMESHTVAVGLRRGGDAPGTLCAGHIAGVIGPGPLLPHGIGHVQLADLDGVSQRGLGVDLQIAREGVHLHGVASHLRVEAQLFALGGLDGGGALPQDLQIVLRISGIGDPEVGEVGVVLPNDLDDIGPGLLAGLGLGVDEEVALPLALDQGDGDIRLAGRAGHIGRAVQGVVHPVVGHAQLLGGVECLAADGDEVGGAGQPDHIPEHLLVVAGAIGAVEQVALTQFGKGAVGPVEDALVELGLGGGLVDAVEQVHIQQSGLAGLLLAPHHPDVVLEALLCVTHRDDEFGGEVLLGKVAVGKVQILLLAADHGPVVGREVNRGEGGRPVIAKHALKPQPAVVVIQLHQVVGVLTIVPDGPGSGGGVVGLQLHQRPLLLLGLVGCQVVQGHQRQRVVAAVDDHSVDRLMELTAVVVVAQGNLHGELLHILAQLLLLEGSVETAGCGGGAGGHVLEDQVLGGKGAVAGGGNVAVGAVGEQEGIVHHLHGDLGIVVQVLGGGPDQEVLLALPHLTGVGAHGGIEGLVEAAGRDAKTGEHGCVGPVDQQAVLPHQLVAALGVAGHPEVDSCPVSHGAVLVHGEVDLHIADAAGDGGPVAILSVDLQVVAGGHHRGHNPEALAVAGAAQAALGGGHIVEHRGRELSEDVAGVLHAGPFLVQRDASLGEQRPVDRLSVGVGDGLSLAILLGSALVQHMEHMGLRQVSLRAEHLDVQPLAIGGHGDGHLIDRHAGSGTPSGIGGPPSVDGHPAGGGGDAQGHGQRFGAGEVHHGAALAARGIEGVAEAAAQRHVAQPDGALGDVVLVEEGDGVALADLLLRVVHVDEGHVPADVAAHHGGRREGGAGNGTHAGARGHIDVVVEHSRIEGVEQLQLGAVGGAHRQAGEGGAAVILAAGEILVDAGHGQAVDDEGVHVLIVGQLIVVDEDGEVVAAHGEGHVLQGDRRSAAGAPGGGDDLGGAAQLGEGSDVQLGHVPGDGDVVLLEVGLEAGRQGALADGELLEHHRLVALGQAHHVDEHPVAGLGAVTVLVHAEGLDLDDVGRAHSEVDVAAPVLSVPAGEVGAAQVARAVHHHAVDTQLRGIGGQGARVQVRHLVGHHQVVELVVGVEEGGELQLAAQDVVVVDALHGGYCHLRAGDRGIGPADGLGGLAALTVDDDGIDLLLPRRVGDLHLDDVVAHHQVADRAGEVAVQRPAVDGDSVGVGLGLPARQGDGVAAVHPDLHAGLAVRDGDEVVVDGCGEVGVDDIRHIQQVAHLQAGVLRHVGLGRGVVGVDGKVDQVFLGGHLAGAVTALVLLVDPGDEEDLELVAGVDDAVTLEGVGVLAVDELAVHRRTRAIGLHPDHHHLDLAPCLFLRPLGRGEGDGAGVIGVVEEVIDPLAVPGGGHRGAGGVTHGDDVGGVAAADDAAVELHQVDVPGLAGGGDAALLVLLGGGDGDGDQVHTLQHLQHLLRRRTAAQGAAAGLEEVAAAHGAHPDIGHIDIVRSLDDEINGVGSLGHGDEVAVDVLLEGGHGGQLEAQVGELAVHQGVGGRAGGTIAVDRQGLEAAPAQIAGGVVRDRLQHEPVEVAAQGERDVVPVADHLGDVLDHRAAGVGIDDVELVQVEGIVPAGDIGGQEGHPQLRRFSVFHHGVEVHIALVVGHRPDELLAVQGHVLDDGQIQDGRSRVILEVGAVAVEVKAVRVAAVTAGGVLAQHRDVHPVEMVIVHLLHRQGNGLAAHHHDVEVAGQLGVGLAVVDAVRDLVGLGGILQLVGHRHQHHILALAVIQGEEVAVARRVEHRREVPVLLAAHDHLNVLEVGVAVAADVLDDDGVVAGDAAVLGDNSHAHDVDTVLDGHMGQLQVGVVMVDDAAVGQGDLHGCGVHRLEPREVDARGTAGHRDGVDLVVAVGIGDEGRLDGEFQLGVPGAGGGGGAAGGELFQVGRVAVLVDVELILLGRGVEAGQIQVVVVAQEEGQLHAAPLAVKVDDEGALAVEDLQILAQVAQGGHVPVELDGLVLGSLGRCGGMGTQPDLQGAAGYAGHEGAGLAAVQPQLVAVPVGGDGIALSGLEEVADGVHIDVDEVPLHRGKLHVVVGVEYPGGFHGIAVVALLVLVDGDDLAGDGGGPLLSGSALPARRGLVLFRDGGIGGAALAVGALHGTLAHLGQSGELGSGGVLAHDPDHTVGGDALGAVGRGLQEPLLGLVVEVGLAALDRGRYRMGQVAALAVGTVHGDLGHGVDPVPGHRAQGGQGAVNGVGAVNTLVVADHVHEGGVGYRCGGVLIAHAHPLQGQVGALAEDVHVVVLHGAHLTGDHDDEGVQAVLELHSLHGRAHAADQGAVHHALAHLHALLDGDDGAGELVVVRGDAVDLHPIGGEVHLVVLVLAVVGDAVVVVGIAQHAPLGHGGVVGELVVTDGVGLLVVHVHAGHPEDDGHGVDLHVGVHLCHVHGVGLVCKAGVLRLIVAHLEGDLDLGHGLGRLLEGLVVGVGALRDLVCVVGVGVVVLVVVQPVLLQALQEGGSALGGVGQDGELIRPAVDGGVDVHGVVGDARHEGLVEGHPLLRLHLSAVVGLQIIQLELEVDEVDIHPVGVDHAVGGGDVDEQQVVLVGIVEALDLLGDHIVAVDVEAAVGDIAAAVRLGHQVATGIPDVHHILGAEHIHQGGDGRGGHLQQSGAVLAQDGDIAGHDAGLGVQVELHIPAVHADVVEVLVHGVLAHDGVNGDGPLAGGLHGDGYHRGLALELHAFVAHAVAVIDQVALHVAHADGDVVHVAHDGLLGLHVGVGGLQNDAEHVGGEHLLDVEVVVLKTLGEVDVALAQTVEPAGDAAVHLGPAALVEQHLAGGDGRTDGGRELLGIHVLAEPLHIAEHVHLTALPLQLHVGLVLDLDRQVAGQVHSLGQDGQAVGLADGGLALHGRGGDHDLQIHGGNVLAEHQLHGHGAVAVAADDLRRALGDGIALLVQHQTDDTVASALLVCVAVSQVGVGAHVPQGDGGACGLGHQVELGDALLRRALHELHGVHIGQLAGRRHFLPFQLHQLQAGAHGDILQPDDVVGVVAVGGGDPDLHIIDQQAVNHDLLPIGGGVGVAHGPAGVVQSQVADPLAVVLDLHGGTGVLGLQVEAGEGGTGGQPHQIGLAVHQHTGDILAAGHAVVGQVVLAAHHPQVGVGRVAGDGQVVDAHLLAVGGGNLGVELGGGGVADGVVHAGPAHAAAELAAVDVVDGHQAGAHQGVDVDVSDDGVLANGSGVVVNGDLGLIGVGVGRADGPVHIHGLVHELSLHSAGGVVAHVADLDDGAQVGDVLHLGEHQQSHGHLVGLVVALAVGAGQVVARGAAQQDGVEEALIEAQGGEIQQDVVLAVGVVVEVEGVQAAVDVHVLAGAAHAGVDLAGGLVHGHVGLIDGGVGHHQLAALGSIGAGTQGDDAGDRVLLSHNAHAAEEDFAAGDEGGIAQHGLQAAVGDEQKLTVVAHRQVQGGGAAAFLLDLGGIAVVDGHIVQAEVALLLDQDQVVDVGAHVAGHAADHHAVLHAALVRAHGQLHEALVHDAPQGLAHELVVLAVIGGIDVKPRAHIGQVEVTGDGVLAIDLNDGVILLPDSGAQAHVQGESGRRHGEHHLLSGNRGLGVLVEAVAHDGDSLETAVGAGGLEDQVVDGAVGVGPGGEVLILVQNLNLELLPDAGGDVAAAHGGAGAPGGAGLIFSVDGDTGEGVLGLDDDLDAVSVAADAGGELQGDRIAVFILAPLGHHAVGRELGVIHTHLVDPDGVDVVLRHGAVHGLEGAGGLAGDVVHLQAAHVLVALAGVAQLKHGVGHAAVLGLHAHVDPLADLVPVLGAQGGGQVLHAVVAVIVVLVAAGLAAPAPSASGAHAPDIGHAGLFLGHDTGGQVEGGAHAVADLALGNIAHIDVEADALAVFVHRRHAAPVVQKGLLGVAQAAVAFLELLPGEGQGGAPVLLILELGVTAPQAGAGVDVAVTHRLDGAAARDELDTEGVSLGGAAALRGDGEAKDTLPVFVEGHPCGDAVGPGLVGGAAHIVLAVHSDGVLAQAGAVELGEDVGEEHPGLPVLVGKDVLGAHRHGVLQVVAH